MSKLSRLSYVGLGKETVMGTAVAPTVFPPTTANGPEDIIAPLRDESFRGNDSLLQGLYGGAADSTYDIAGMPYPDTFGNFLRAIIGPDVVTAPVAPATLSGHLFKSNNTQAPTYTLTDYDLVEARAFPGCLLSDLNIKIDTKGAVTYDAKWMGWPSAGAATPVPPFTALQPWLGWQLTWSAGGVSSTRVETTDLNFKRAVDMIAGSDGIQSPRESFAEGLGFTATAKILFEDNTDLNRFLTYAQQAVTATLTQPLSQGGAILAVTCSKASWNKAKRDMSGKYATLDVNIDGVYNATDAGPAQVTLTGPQATAY